NIPLALTLLGAANKQLLEVNLLVTMEIGTIKAIEKKRHPCRATLEKCDPEFGESLKDPVRQHAGGLYGDTERVAERVNRIVSAKAVHAEVMQGSHMHR